MTLQKVMDLQQKFQKRLGFDADNMSAEELTAYIKENVFFVVEELHEMTRELPYVKGWKDYSQLTPEQLEVRNLRAREEFIDVLTFSLNIACALGFTEQEIYREFISKNITNHGRQEAGYVETEEN